MTVAAMLEVDVRTPAGRHVPAMIVAVDAQLEALAVRIHHAREQREEFLLLSLLADADRLLEERWRLMVEIARRRAQGVRGL